MRLALVALLVLCACTPLDRGKCLAAHLEWRDGGDITIDIGEIPVTFPQPDYQVTICDRWEYPHGKAEQGP